MKRVIISGGGTGGHIFPAVSIANAIKARYPEVEILFVGAENRMEMERVPTAGYKIIGLPVAGFDRKHLFRNIGVLIKLQKSLSLARKIIRDFKPEIAIGVGGYASGPTLKAANKKNIPTLLQEQNSYAGVTNKLLAKKAAKICVAYDGMEKFFPKDKIVLTGNPVRQDLQCSEEKRKEAYDYFKLDPDKKTILVIGGSLGARTINQSISNLMENEEWRMKNEMQNLQIIWQTGKIYFKQIEEELINHYKQKEFTDNSSFFIFHSSFYITEFISRMDLAYSIADLIISRAGAGSISEFCMLGKPVILVPSPNVAEDHQTKNALALVNKNAAVMIADKDAGNQLVDKALELIHNEAELQSLSANILKLALPDAANSIVDEIEKILKK
ncbi:MAG: undecaprenyldiphospho-muramoylpentapeptide beta-N-acetylglucosaminyltransferase [Candidatus Azobacteroides sp.]|nr:undecaprenyldiphospho-muramoylpentapeptide beta-N-acetylglucosaminyltransferase [Candidatus Azobacteroides sp.]